jgi:hypothetical protein
MKASDVRRGDAQFKRVELELVGDGGRVEVGLAPLRPGQESEVFARARAYAKKKAAEAGNPEHEPQEGDEVYEFAKSLFRCLIGVVDADSDPKRPEPFFDGGLQQIEEMGELMADGVLALARRHVAYQDELQKVTHRVGNADTDEFKQLLEEMAGPLALERYFSLRPGIAASFTITTVRLLLTLLQDRFSGGSDAVASSTTATNNETTTNEGVAGT